MRAFVTCLVLALCAAVALSQTASVSLFTVAEVDRTCNTVQDCTFVGTSCCFESTCNYNPVNLTAAAKYQERLRASVQTCAATPCMGALCAAPVLACSVLQNLGSTTKYCVFERPVTQPPTNNTGGPVCSAIGIGSGCENMCVDTSNMALPPTCAATGIPQCINKCKNTFATCGVVESAAAGSTSPLRKCGYIAQDQALFNQCVDACRIPPPPPDLCQVSSSNGCEKSCVAVDPTAPIANIACTPTTQVACYNECKNQATCNRTQIGCAFVPKDATLFEACIKRCAPPPNQCFKTGCSGEICSSVPVVSTCQYTCRTACYQNAVCQASATGQCSFVATTELNACLAKCEPIIDPPPAECKISGCQRDLCVPSTEPAMGCPTTQLVEPTCEQRCLQYAQCSASSRPLTNAAGAALTCGWVPDPLAPGRYGECLLKCKTPANPCVVSGCGAVCSTTASLEPCNMLLVRPDCMTACKMQYTSCNLTSAGCNFIPLEGLRACQEKCGTIPPPNPCANMPAVECLVDPCQNAKCPAFPDAKCQADRCSCRPIFVDATGARVNCEASCAGLRCNDCNAKPGCSFCRGQYAVSDANTGVAVTKDYGFCVPSTAASAERCLANNGRILDPSMTCPVIAADDGSTNGDVGSVQDEVVNHPLPVSQKFVIVISLIVNSSAADVKGFNLINVFVDLIGAGTPDDNDRTEVCEILKTAIKKVDGRLANVASSLLTCKLDPKSTVKRDSSYVAGLSFPASGNSANAVTAVFSVVALVAGVLAALF